jgi:hypothetical protein
MQRDYALKTSLKRLEVLEIIGDARAAILAVWFVSSSHVAKNMPAVP